MMTTRTENTVSTFHDDDDLDFSMGLGASVTTTPVPEAPTATTPPTLHLTRGVTYRGARYIVSGGEAYRRTRGGLARVTDLALVAILVGRR